MVKNIDSTSILATRLASETASKAADLATATANTAVTLASKTAESIAAITTNIDWMKQSLSGIESKLNEMDKAFVTAAQHLDVTKELETHENRINTLETEKTRSTVLLTIGGAIVSLMLTLLIYHLLGKG